MLTFPTQLQARSRAKSYSVVLLHLQCTLQCVLQGALRVLGMHFEDTVYIPCMHLVRVGCSGNSSVSLQSNLDSAIPLTTCPLRRTLHAEKFLQRQVQVEQATDLEMQLRKDLQ